MSQETITLEVHNFLKLSPTMLEAKADSEVMKNWFGGMCWKWDGGESMTVMVGEVPWHLISYRDRVVQTHVWGGSIARTLEAEYGVKVVVA